MPLNLQKPEVFVLLHIDNPVRVPPDDTPIEGHLIEVSGLQLWILALINTLVRSHEERKCSVLKPTESRMSPSMVYHTKINPDLEIQLQVRIGVESLRVDVVDGVQWVNG